jgi:replicative DNA helicase
VARRALRGYHARAVTSEGARIPPHSDDAERAVLGALLLAPDRIPEVAEQLAAEDFFSKRHRLLYECLLELSTRGVPIDFVSVGEALKALGTFQAVGGNAVLIELAQDVTSAAHVAHHARIVAQTSVLRKLIAEASAVIEEAFGTPAEEESVRALLDASEHRIFSIVRSSNQSGVDPIRGILTETFQRLEAKSKHELTGLDTGYYELNDKLCGLNRGDLIILAARPAMGKTALALNLIENGALRGAQAFGRNPVVLLFSLEMGKQQIASRMLCSRARVDAHKLRTGRIPPEDYAQLNEAAGELARANIFIDDTPGMSVMALRARARRVLAKHGLDLIVIDYLQLMSHPKAESRQMEISAISRSLKALARELDVPVMALAQLSRQVESRDSKRPILSDLRESGSIEQDADVVLMLYRREYYEREECPEEERGKAEVIIAKHRNGPTGELKLQFFPSIMRFENPALSAAQPIFSGGPD